MGIISRFLHKKEPITPPAKAPVKQPSPGAVEEAKSHPDGWVYEIAGNYGPNDAVPPEAILGAWKVDQTGTIIGEFIPNPSFKPPAKK